MTEPTYEYVKGHGWVPSTSPLVIVKLKNGKRYKLESRRPQHGEFHSSVYQGNHNFSVRNLGREPDLEKFKTYFETLDNYDFKTTFDRDNDDYLDRLWVTVVPLD